MKKLHLLIVKSYIGPLFITFIISVFLLLMQFLWKYLDDLVGKGLQWDIIAELLFYASASFVPMALPLAILLSSLMTFGNLGEHYELVALKSAGISLQRIMFPLVIVSIIISICAFFFSNNILPYTNLKMRSLLYDVRNQRPELNIKPGVFYKGIEGYAIKVAKKDHNTNTLYNVMIYDHKSRYGNLYVTIADSGYMRVTPDKGYLVFKLYNGYNYSELEKEDNKYRRNKTYPFRKDKFEEETVIFEMVGFGLTRTDEALFKNNYQMLNLTQLAKNKDSLSTAMKERRNSFADNLYRSNYFKRKGRIQKNDSLRKVIPVDSTMSLNMDSLFHTLPVDKKRKIVDMAANYARATQSYISTTRSDFTARTRWINKHNIEWHRKFTLSIACLILFFIGAPLGAIIRKGGLGMPVVVSVILFILYYIIDTMGVKTVQGDVYPAYIGMWLSSIILLPVGVFLTYKAATDSVILNIDTYIYFYKKIPMFKKKKN